MADVWKLTVYGKPVTEVPSGLIDQWEAIMLANRTRISSKLLGKITEATYNALLADPSSSRYADFIEGATGPFDYDAIKLKQDVKVHNKGATFVADVTSAFGATGAFPVSVTAKKGKMSAVKPTIGMVGAKYAIGWKCGSLMALALGGDKRIGNYISLPDKIEPNIDALIPALVAPWVTYDKPVAVASITKAGVLLSYTTDAQEALRTTIKNNLKTVLTEIATHVVGGHTLTFDDPAYTIADGLKLVATLATA